MKHYVSAGSNAGLSPYFDAAGVSARGRYTVVFRLKAPLGSFPYLLSQTTYQAIIQPASIVGEARHVGQERDDRDRAVQAARSYVEKRSASSGPQHQVLGWPRSARRRANHLLPGQRADGARTAGGTDRPRVPAVAAGGAAVQEQQALHLLLAARLGSPAGLHADRRRAVPGRAGSAGRGARDQPAAADREGHARRRDARERQPVLEEVPLDPPGDRAAEAEPGAGEGAAQSGERGRREVQAHDVGLPRPHRPCRVPPGLRASGRHRHGHRGHGRRQVLRLRAGGSGLRDDHAVAQPTQHADGVRLARCADHLPEPLLHVGRGLERLALQEPGVRPGRQERSSLLPRSRHSGGRQGRWRRSSRAIRPSSSTTSSTT